MEIESIQFGVLSHEEILKISVAEINQHKLMSNIKNKDIYNTLYDPRMGPMEPNHICVTCDLPTKNCPGHFGHILLNVKIIHPLYYRMMLNFLRCVCIKCSSLLIAEEHVELWNFKKLKGEQRFNQILNKISKIKFCSKCSLLQPKYTLSTREGMFYISYKTHKVQFNTEDIYKVISNISDNDIKILGFDVANIHPVNIIMTALPVLPPRARPFIMDDVISDDDLTLGYAEIIKVNNLLGNKDLSETKRQKNTEILIFRIKTLFDNTAGKAKHINSRPMKGIKERVCGKDGIIRGNLMGKRVNFSARTVIGPDPTLRLNEIAVPEEICDNESYPERVTSHNIDRLQEMVWKGMVNIIDKRSINARIHVNYTQKKLQQKVCQLDIGDIVHRRIQDGDIALLNRQPTLHKGSMLAKRIVRRKGKTIRMNLATTSTFNADFDGDEMNLFFPQSEQAKTELIELSATEQNMIGSQSSSSVISIVQDALLSAYLMTRDNEEIPQHVFYQITMKCDTSLGVAGGLSYDHIQRKLKMAKRIFQKHNKQYALFCGKVLFSLILPDTLNYTSTNRALPDEPVLKIEKGIIYEGALNKTNLKGSHGSLITILHNEYCNLTSLHFVNNAQFLCNEYLMYRGFTIGIGDCLSDVRKSGKLQEIITSCLVEAQSHQETINNERIKEIKINMALSKAKDIGMRLAKESLSDTNNFVATVTSGSKGDFFNIAQIMGLLGQQNVSGGRIRCHLNNQSRTLPHYSFDSDSFEARGFIQNSFLKGLNPKEFWFHAMSGREGLTDTATKTAQTGYTQRKMVKIMEDVQVKYDQTVRNSVGSIIQFAYGHDNLCSTKTTISDDGPFFCNVDRLVDKINTEYEIKEDLY